MINITQLDFSYDVNRVIVGLNMTLKAHGIYGLLGKNGAGKTSLLKILCGLLFPLKGSCHVMGYTPKDRLRAFLAQIFLIPEILFVPDVTAKQYASLYAGFYPTFDLSVYFSLLEEFDIPVNTLLTRLSYGQKKKSLIAFGIATGCPLLVMDEPTNGLDIPSKSQFRKIVADAASQGRTFIISTHQVRDVEHLVDAVIIIDQGKVIFQESVKMISAHLHFRHYASLPTGEGILYSEKTPGGYLAIVKRVCASGSRISDNSTDVSPINMELLFNAVMYDSKFWASLFQK